MPTSTPNRWLIILCAMAFLLGGLLGVGLTLLVRPAATTSRPAAAAPITSPSAGLVIPASCRQAVDKAQQASSTAEDALQALRRLDTARLQRLLDQLQDAQHELDTLAQQCRDQTGTPTR
ncbi:hypothetical protein [Paractinoplanes atraurantiacus]|uniref:Uncharacterized protein n=1 Tax=Paractinoplanes atraurantiacus TaxID=1036182 RepID=A0A285GQF9_9ACTN|nr:hypothetical protein [Actinoplanes atraurantiacus]SNY25533.1 hypothetical protein SAMN05421748_102358 [Actinoplanes atraurantiacus]